MVHKAYSSLYPSLPGQAGIFLDCSLWESDGIPGGKTYDRVGVPIRLGPKSLTLQLVHSSLSHLKSPPVKCFYQCTVLPSFVGVEQPATVALNSLISLDSLGHSPCPCSSVLGAGKVTDFQFVHLFPIASDNFRALYVSELEPGVLLLFNFNPFILLNSRRRSCECDMIFPQ